LANKEATKLPRGHPNQKNVFLVTRGGAPKPGGIFKKSVAGTPPRGKNKKQNPRGVNCVFPHPPHRFWALKCGKTPIPGKKGGEFFPQTQGGGGGKQKCGV